MELIHALSVVVLNMVLWGFLAFFIVKCHQDGDEDVAWLLTLMLALLIIAELTKP